MLCLSQSVGYAVQALAVLGEANFATCLIRDVAAEAQVPPAYLAKLVKRLSDAELVVSKRGIKGGTWLRRKPEDITLLQISEAIDGRKWMNRCLLGLSECSDERACPSHTFWKEARASIQKSLEETTLADVIAFQKERGKKEPLYPAPPVPPPATPAKAQAKKAAPKKAPAPAKPAAKKKTAKA